MPNFKKDISRKSKLCGGPLVMDIATLNKGDPFCPKCVGPKLPLKELKEPEPLEPCKSCKFWIPNINKLGCSYCHELDFKMIDLPEKCIHSKPRENEPEKELYELYLKDKGQYYFKKINHPFTEFNNMVHLGIDQIIMDRYVVNKLVAETIEDLENIRDHVLEAPILSNEVHDYRHYLYKINTNVKNFISKWQKKGEVHKEEEKR